MRISRYIWLMMAAIAFAVAAIVFDAPAIKALIAVAVGAAIVKVGLMMIGGLAQPVPEPAESGLLRKVKLLYECTICGAEVRMTVADSEDPAPPRHCLEDMELRAPTME